MIISTAVILVPAVVIMGYLGQQMGSIVDNPKNRADADYKIAVTFACFDKRTTFLYEELWSESRAA